ASRTDVCRCDPAGRCSGLGRPAGEPELLIQLAPELAHPVRRVDVAIDDDRADGQPARPSAAGLRGRNDPLPFVELEEACVRDIWGAALEFAAPAAAGTTPRP